MLITSKRPNLVIVLYATLIEGINIKRRKVRINVYWCRGYVTEADKSRPNTSLKYIGMKPSVKQTKQHTLFLSKLLCVRHAPLSNAKMSHIGLTRD